MSPNEGRERDRDAQPSPNARNTVERFGTDRDFNGLHRLDRDLGPKRSVFAFKGPFTGKMKANMLLFWT